MKNLVLGLFFGAFCFIQAAFGCSLITNPISKFSDNEYIFIGKVTGYTEMVKSADRKFDAQGLTVAVKESVFLPGIGGSNFELFPVGLEADCSLSGYSTFDLRKMFPVGAEIRVIATRSTIIPQAKESSVIRLEEVPGSLSSIAINTDASGKSIANTTDTFDYATNFKTKNDGNASKYHLPSFELRKDLFRLKNSLFQKDRDAILTRLGSVPYLDDMDYFGVTRTYAANEKEGDRFYETNLKAFSEDGYREYMGVKNARIELEKRGYRSEDIKAAMDKAMSENAGFTADEIVKGALKYLPKKDRRSANYKPAN